MDDTNILFLIRTLNVGGAEHVLVDIANRMAEDGFQVTVQTLIDEGYYKEKLSSKVQYKKSFSVHLAFFKKVLMKLYYTLPAKLLGWLIIDKGYTHLVAFVEDLPTKIVYGYPGKEAKKIAWIHTDLYRNRDTKRTFGAEKDSDCYEKFDRILCVSNDAKEGFLKRVGNYNTVDVQYNPLDKDEIQQKAQEKPAYIVRQTDAFRIVAVGRLTKVKGFDLLLEAMKRVCKESSCPVELYVIGGGNEEAALQEMIREFGLQNHVFLCGQQTNPYSIMRQCDMQVISSRAEGYSLVLCEGHFLGLPVVATKCTGPLEIVENSKGGILVDISADGLADGILEMVNDPSAFEKYKQNVTSWTEAYDADDLYRQIEERFS